MRKFNIERILLVISIITTVSVGAFLGVQKGTSEPVTVYVDGCNKTIPIEMNIAPLEELKGE